ncbi:hypothetical protein FB45DRAFT_481888 [Roridomyces roridus]|uniref:Uncharacterized protein n=1 Tax=Roridomyces roridus TaxID=1738132 RepID=A0AAD7FRL5_9AGAR|nr:hypothetical protein FB45DRAFT_481888 [Roridomyces roridus]
MRFTRLTTLHICGNSHLSRAPEALVMRSLLRTPSLVSVSLRYSLDGLEHFRGMWEGCATGIKHLKLDIHDVMGLPSRSWPMRDLQAGSADRRIKLESLAVSRSFSSAWLRGPGCPFDIRNLKALQIGFQADPLTDALSGSFETIEMLSLEMATIGEVPVSLFRGVCQLKLAHACRSSWDKFHGGLQGRIPQQVRDRISSLSFSLSVRRFDDLETLNAQFPIIHGYFPNLKVLHLNIQWSWLPAQHDPKPDLSLTTNAGLKVTVKFGPGRVFDDFGELWYKRI